MESPSVFKCSNTSREARSGPERQASGLMKLPRKNSFKAVWSEATEIKNVALSPAKILATHQLSLSPNSVDGETQKTRESCACAGVGFSLHHSRSRRRARLDMDFCH